MTEKKKPKKDAPEPPAEASADGAAKRPDRDERGRLLPGHSLPGPGRPALPSEFRGVGAKALKQIEDVLEGRKIVSPEIEQRCRELAVAYTYGKAGKARHTDTGLPESKEERIKLLEDMMLVTALDNNDTVAMTKLLAALDPVRWGDQENDDKPEFVDTLDFVPMVQKPPA